MNEAATVELARLTEWLTATRRSLEALEKAGDVSPQAANGARAMLQAFEREVVKGERAEAAPRWTQVAEGLPAEGEEVLISNTHLGRRQLASYHHETLRTLPGEPVWMVHWPLGATGFVPLKDVSHWLRLPPGPPEGGEEP
jgi:hypothetical protein